MTTVHDVTSAILRREGWPRVTHRAADRGGLTKGGVTADTLGRWRGLGRRATRAELEALTEAEARRIFEVWYYETPRYARLGDPRVEALLYDTTITSGPRTAATLFQRALDAVLPYDPRVRPLFTVDGAIGPRTLAAWRAADPAAVYAALVKERVRFMLGLALHDPAVRAFLETHPTSQLHNANGWVNRCLEFV